MSYAPQISNWDSQQLVTAAEMNLYANDVYQRLGVMEPIKPFILSGFDVSVNGSGLVTVTAGTGISPDMNHSIDPNVPADGVQVIGALTSQLTVQDTAAGAEYGLVVLRQSLTAISNTPNFSVTSTLTYLAGSSSAYPSAGINDIVLVGIVYTGSAYILDYSQRSVSKESYYQSIQGLDYFSNTDFFYWSFGTSAVTALATPVPVCDNWMIYTSALVNPFTAEQYVMSSSERAVVPNSPIYGIQLTRGTADSTSNALDVLEQLATPFWTLNGKILTVNFWAKATASGTLNAAIKVAYTPGNASETSITYISPTQVLIEDSTFHLYTYTIYIGELTDDLGAYDDNYIAVKICLSSVNQTYTVVIAEAHNCGGALYVRPQTTRTQDIKPFWSGDIKQSYSAFGPNALDWLAMDDGTIGSQDSGASSYSGLGVAQAYVALWNQVSNTYLPVVGGRGASAQADFAANKQMFLPATVGRALCNSGTATLHMPFTASGDVLTVGTASSLYSGTPVTVSNSGGALPSPLVADTTYYVVNLSGTTLSLAATAADVNNAGNSPIVITLTDVGSGTNTITIDYAAYAMGQIVGESAHQQLVSEMPAHFHEYFPMFGGGSTRRADLNSDGTPPGASINTGNTGGDGRMNVMQPSTFIPVYVKL
jgi:hypothetical protein